MFSNFKIWHAKNNFFCLKLFSSTWSSVDLCSPIVQNLFYVEYFMGINKLVDELTKISSNSPSPIIQLSGSRSMRSRRNLIQSKVLIKFTDIFAGFFYVFFTNELFSLKVHLTIIVLSTFCEEALEISRALNASPDRSQLWWNAMNYKFIRRK